MPPKTSHRNLLIKGDHLDSVKGTKPSSTDLLNNKTTTKKAQAREDKTIFVKSITMRKRRKRNFKLEMAHWGPKVLLTVLQKTFPRALAGAHRNGQGSGRKQIALGCHPKIRGPWGFCGAVIKAVMVLVTLGRNGRNWRWKGRLSSWVLPRRMLEWRSLCEMRFWELNEHWDYSS